MCPPGCEQHEGSSGAIDGNSHFYGFECENLGDGRDPWPAAQLDAIERTAAAICRIHSWSARSVIGHLEWSDWKNDPRGFGMPDMRARIGRRLGGKPSGPTTPAPVTVSLTHVVAAARQDPAAAQGHITYRADVLVVEQALQAEGLLDGAWVDGSFGTRTVTAYAALQRRYGYSGSDADGIPGKTSLIRLGAAHGFTVKD
ncbi:N-acetylmuramoyl-L-alanine amidase [Streptomyces sp. cg36]|uniref:peptidoglycan recognition protein family protein n=1 Tax=Streptomyces sp. cg36 TaxID=3238798 RepID=UPI0034E2F6AD